MSLPTRGAWIEILEWYYSEHPERSLPTRGAWIEILRGFCFIQRVAGRSPHGERGLKYLDLDLHMTQLSVAPHTGSVD